MHVQCTCRRGTAVECLAPPAAPFWTQVGDVVRVVEKFDDGWWNGERHGQTGLFTANYVEML